MNKDERTKYNILGFHFTCFHECHEWKWKICVHCRSRNTCQDHTRYVYSSEEGIYYATEQIEISPLHTQDLGIYIHEFTEAIIIRILRKYHKDWNATTEIKGYRRTFIAHFISLWGVNGTCLEPVTKKNRPKW